MQINQYSSSADFWLSVADFAAYAVALGVFAEILELFPKILKAVLNWPIFTKQKQKFKSTLNWFKKHEHALDLWAFGFWMVIVLALAGEVVAAQKARHFDSLAMEELTKQATVATEQSSIAISEAAASNLLAKQLDSTNILLRTELVKLEAAVSWRNITPEQDKIIFEILSQFSSTHPMFNKSIYIEIGWNMDFEANRYAKQICGLLTKSGFSATIQSPGLYMRDEAVSSESPVGLTIGENGIEVSPSMEALTSAFDSAGIAYRTWRHDKDVPDKITITVWHKPEK